MDPANLKYAKSHEWVHVEDDQATIGVTDFAVKQLTDLVYVELPPVGTKVQAGEGFGEIESVKAVSDLYAPVSGEVIEINEPLADDLGILSDDPYEKGWMVKMKLSDPSDLDALMDRAAYEKHCESEEH